MSKYIKTFPFFQALHGQGDIFLFWFKNNIFLSFHMSVMVVSITLIFLLHLVFLVYLFRSLWLLYPNLFLTIDIKMLESVLFSHFGKSALPPYVATMNVDGHSARRISKSQPLFSWHTFPVESRLLLEAIVDVRQW